MSVLDDPLDEFDVVRVISKAYNSSFTSSKVKSGFATAGILKLDELCVIRHSSPVSFARSDFLVNVADMCVVMDKTRKRTSQELLYSPRVLYSGFVDTSKGAAVIIVGATKQLMK